MRQELAADMKGDEPTAAQQAVIDQIAAWIVTSIIAEVIAEELIDHGKEVTIENCKATWYTILEDLHAQVHEAIRQKE